MYSFLKFKNLTTSIQNEFIIQKRIYTFSTRVHRKCVCPEKFSIYCYTVRLSERRNLQYIFTTYFRYNFVLSIS